MTKKRLFTRHPIMLEVTVRDGDAWTKLVTADISRRGVYLCTERPAALNRIVQLRMALPDGGRIEVMGRVRRTAKDKTEDPLGAGMGIEFFALSDKDRDLWDEYIFEQRRRGQAAGNDFAETSQILRDAVAPKELRDLLQAMRLAGDLRDPESGGTPAAGATSAPVAGPTSGAAATDSGAKAAAPAQTKTRTVSVRPGNADRLAQLAERCRAASTIFLRTAVPFAHRQALDIALVHPESDAEFLLRGSAERVVTADDGTYAGVQVRLPQLDAAQRVAFDHFVSTGQPDGESDALVGTENTYVAGLRTVVEAAPGSAMAHAELGWAQLIDEDKPEAAVESFLAAIELDDRFAPAHRGLALAYALAGDPARARAFGRIARDLEVFART